MSNPGQIRVIIVDDIPESRENVARLLKFEPDFEIVGLAEGGAEGVELAVRLEPDIVLMDINMPGVDGLTATGQITSRLPNTAVIMMSVDNDPDILRRSMMVGAREFLAKPFSLDELTSAIRYVGQLAKSNRRVVAEPVAAAGAQPAAAKKTKFVSLYSLKGGVGRSIVAANLAIALRQKHPGSEVVLIDGNLIHGDIAVLLNLTENKTVTDLVRNINALDRDLLMDVIVQHSSGIRALLAPPNAQAGEQVTGEHMSIILEHLDGLADYVIIDCRPGFDEVTLALLDHSDRVFALLNRELTAIKGAKEYLELADLLGYEDGKISLVMNRATNPAGIPIEEIQTSLRGELLARIPDDPQLVVKSINEGVPIAQSNPNSPFMQEIAKLAAMIDVDTPAKDEADEARKPSGGLITRLVRPMSRKKAS